MIPTHSISANSPTPRDVVSTQFRGKWSSSPMDESQRRLPAKAILLLMFLIHWILAFLQSVCIRCHGRKIVTNKDNFIVHAHGEPLENHRASVMLAHVLLLKCKDFEAEVSRVTHLVWRRRQAGRASMSWLGAYRDRHQLQATAPWQNEYWSRLVRKGLSRYFSKWFLCRNQGLSTWSMVTGNELAFRWRQHLCF